MPSYKRLDENGASKFAEEIFAKVKEVVDAIPGGGGGNANIRMLTETEYNALTDAQKKNGTLYLVADDPHIDVTTMPTKTTYSGDDYSGGLDLTGIVVEHIDSDGTKTNVTSSCVFNPANGSSLTPPQDVSQQTITVSYTASGKTYTTSFQVTLQPQATISGVEYLEVASEPTKTEYNVGDALDLSGIEVRLMDGAGNGTDVTSSCTFSPPSGTIINETTDVTISYVSDGITLTTEVTVVV